MFFSSYSEQYSPSLEQHPDVYFYLSSVSQHN